jgi:hypothetical protein
MATAGAAAQAAPWWPSAAIADEVARPAASTIDNATFFIFSPFALPVFGTHFAATVDSDPNPATSLFAAS